MDQQIQTRLNEIFNELETQSHIRLEYRVSQSSHTDSDRIDYDLLSVNGFPTCDEFANEIKSRCHKTLLGIKNDVQVIPGLDVIKFTEEALNRIKVLKGIVVIEELDSEGGAFQLHSFHHPEYHWECDILVNKDQLNPGFEFDVDPYAKCWFELLVDAEKTMDQIYRSITYSPVIHILDNRDTEKSDSISDSIPKKIPNAFRSKKYASDPSCIDDVFNVLFTNGYISNIGAKAFRKIFNNEQPDMPIIWLGSISDLAYFIKLIHQHNRYIDRMHHSIWEVTNILFRDSKGHPFGRKRLKQQKPPALQEHLKKAASYLK